MNIYVGMLAYNSVPLIEYAIKSVAPYVDKVFVVDGGSDDHTVEVAKASAGNVIVVMGTYHKKDGSWNEQTQRQTYFDLMPCGQDNWCLVADFDEVYSEEAIVRLVKYIKNADPETRLISHGWLHFWRNISQVRVDSHFGRVRDYGVIRLIEGVHQTSYCTVGDSVVPNFGGLRSPSRVVVEDVIGYHYGWARPYHELREKAINYYNTGYYKLRENYPTVEEYLRWWEAREKEWYKHAELVRFFGEHPKVVAPLIGTYLKEIDHESDSCEGS